MAARDNQGYLIAVILLCLLSVILLIATYFGFSKLNEVVDQRDSANDSVAKAQNQIDAYRDQSEILKAYLGVEGFSVSTADQALQRITEDDVKSETESIVATFKQDMERYSSKPEGVDASYRGLVDDALAALNNKHADIAVLNENIKRAQDKAASEIAAKGEELKAINTRLTAALGDLENEQQQHNQTRNELNSKLQISEDFVKNLQQDLAAKTATIANDTAKHAALVAEKTKRIEELKARLWVYENPETDVADGQIVSIAPILGKVVINLGYDDNLRPQQAFAIYDQQVTNFQQGQEKAKIEVIRILDSHLAEARIIQQDLVNPILTRDFIVTTVWDPGYSVPIAIVGFIDLDGDKRSDLQRLISIVEQNGGKVVAYHDEEGNVVGAIDETVRYFVKGDQGKGKTLNGYQILDDQRKRFEVREISVRELLNSMGHRTNAKIQRFEGEVGKFKKRQPSTIDEGSAFPDDGK